MAVKWMETHGRRYYVGSVTGYEIRPGWDSTGGTTNRPPGTTWCVFDAHYMHREVAVFSTGRNKPRMLQRARALRLCAELNAEEEAELACQNGNG